METQLEGKLLKVIQRRSKAINSCTNNMIGSPSWNKLKSLIRLYYKKAGITELTLAESQEISQLNRDYSRAMTLEINKEIFR